MSSVRELAAKSLHKSQQRAKKLYDRKSDKVTYRIGDWVLIKFPQEESGKNRKLSHPWHGPFRVVSCNDPDVTAVKVYRPQDGQIQVHQNRVTPWPGDIISGFYWYGRKKHSPGRPPQWLLSLDRAVEGSQPSAGESSEVCNAPEEVEVTIDEETESTEIERSTIRADEATTGRYALRKMVSPPKRLH